MSDASKVTTATKIVQRPASARSFDVEADICVAGAGISGISAAIEAARLGRKVVLVDGLPALGGQAVNSIIGTFCGVFHNGDDRYQFTYGIADEILTDLGASGDLYYRVGPGWTTVFYDEVALGRWIEEAIVKEGIELVLGATIRGVSLNDRRIGELDIATRYGDVRLNAGGFVDATGDAVLAWLAGLPCREPADGPIYGSQMVVLENVHMDKAPSREELAEVMADKAKDYGVVREDGLAFFFEGKGTVALNMTHMETPLEPLAASRMGLEGRAQTRYAIDLLKAEFPDCFKDATVRAYGFPGIRQTRWIKGKYQLTVEDVRSARKFDDGVARTAWGLEIHNDKHKLYWEGFDKGEHVHQVPLSAMVCPDADNLVAAGRCIDGDVAALSSVRVMAPCMAMGAAAAHALDLAGSGSIHQIDMAALKDRLKDNLERRDYRDEANP
ncbi:MAG: FAD-dependent oxidoreductase [Rhodospirillales bacterium]|nr:FAD-dependent oxidoreductase [Rhodospirillales bacterium]